MLRGVVFPAVHRGAAARHQVRIAADHHIGVLEEVPGDLAAKPKIGWKKDGTSYERDLVLDLSSIQLKIYEGIYNIYIYIIRCNSTFSEKKNNALQSVVSLVEGSARTPDTQPLYKV